MALNHTLKALLICVGCKPLRVYDAELQRALNRAAHVYFSGSARML